MRIAIAFMLVLGACVQPAPVGVRGSTVPPDTAAQCSDICRSIGLPMESVVVMANNVGCVCSAAQPAAPIPPGTPAPAPAASGTTGGMAAILMQEAAAQAAAASAAQQQQQRQQQQQQQQYHH